MSRSFIYRGFSFDFIEKPRVNKLCCECEVIIFNDEGRFKVTLNGSGVGGQKDARYVHPHCVDDHKKWIDKWLEPSKIEMAKVESGR